MALGTADSIWGDGRGNTLRSSSLGNLFADAKVGAATDYHWLEWLNGNTTANLTGVTAWLTSVTAGAAVALAFARGPQAQSTDWTFPTFTSLTFTAPTTQASGIAVPDVPPGQKILLAVRRIPADAALAKPQTAFVNLGGTSPQ